jgi:hypothetical protein
MKMLQYTLLVILVVALSVQGLAQKSGDYRTNVPGGGTWSATATWQTYNGSSWVAAGSAPTGAQTAIIQSTDSLYFDVPVTITDTLRNQGKMGNVSNLTIGSTGTYQHDRDGGSLPVATWDDGSTLYLTGPTGSAPSNGKQHFFNVTYNTPGLLSNLNLGWDTLTIRGNITVVNTSAARWQMAAPAAGDSSIFTLAGDVIVTGGSYSSNGTSNANTKIVIHQLGNIVVTGGNLSVSRGSQGSGTGSTRWYLHNGNFSMSNATTQNSNAANAWFVFDKPGVQTLTLGAGNTLTALPIEVSAGTTLDMGASRLRGSGRFMLDAGATMSTTLAGGVDTAVSVSGAVTMDTAASFIFDGSAAQVTGLTMPATVKNLVINNPAGVKLSQATTINGVLHLVAGVFDNTIAFTLGAGGSISYEGGSLLVPLGVGPGAGQLPVKFFVNQNYPNPFNPTTTIRFGLPAEAQVTAKVYNMLGQAVATLYAGKMIAGVHDLTFNPVNLGSGIYLCRIQAGNAAETRRMMYIK